MIKRQECLDRIRGVEREFLAADAAVTLLEERLHADPLFGNSTRWRTRDASRLRDNLEATYLLRMFAEFESGLRDIWTTFFKQTTQPPMRDLLAALAARRPIAPDWLDTAHRVRLFRNFLVHQGEATATTTSLREARQFLCRYFSCMPENW
jgi:hypothetical protein